MRADIEAEMEAREMRRRLSGPSPSATAASPPLQRNRARASDRRTNQQEVTIAAFASSPSERRRLTAMFGYVVPRAPVSRRLTLGGERDAGRRRAMSSLPENERVYGGTQEERKETEVGSSDDQQGSDPSGDDGRDDDGDAGGYPRPLPRRTPPDEPSDDDEDDEDEDDNNMPANRGGMHFNTTSFTTMHSAVGEYEGGGTEVLELFFFQIERVCREKDVSITRRSHFRAVERVLEANLSRTMLKWYWKEKKDRIAENPLVEITSWKKAKAAFIHMYGTQHEADLAMNDWHNGTMNVKSGEDVFAYIVRMIEFRERLSKIVIPPITFMDRVLRSFNSSFHEVYVKLWPQTARVLVDTGLPMTLHAVRQATAIIQRTIMLNKPEHNKQKGHQQHQQQNQTGAASQQNQQSGNQQASNQQGKSDGGKKKGNGRKLNAIRTKQAEETNAAAGAAASTTPAGRSRVTTHIQYTTEEFARLKASGRCYNCGQMGHPRWQCTNAQVDLKSTLQGE